MSLAARASFVRNVNPQADGEPVSLDLAFSLEGAWNTFGARVEQSEGRVRATMLANPDGAPVANIRAQLERILCLDVDGAAFEKVVALDAVAEELRKLRPGLRPVLFPSPYEAAARAIIGQQLPVRIAAAIHARIAEQHGVAVALDDRTLHGFPSPARLADLSSVRGLAQRKVEHLRALGRVAADGLVDTARLRAMGRDEATSHLTRLPGIGPFSAELIMLRGAGDPDAFPLQEKRLHRAMAVAYRLGEEPSLERLEGIAEGWRPYRSWVGLLLRDAGWVA